MDVSRLEALEPPYEIYEFPPAVPVRFVITTYKIGKMKIQPRFPGSPAEKEIEAIRLFVNPVTKPYFPPYYDLTPRRVVHQLAGMLVQGIPPGAQLEITRDIAGPQAHFSIRWVAG